MKVFVWLVYYVTISRQLVLASKTDSSDDDVVPIPKSSFFGNLFINEAMSDNRKTLADPFGDFEDWVELFNGGDQPVNLGQFYLSDNEANLMVFRLPQVVLQPGGFYIVWCTDAKVITHAPFKLNQDGEKVLLVQHNAAWGVEEDDDDDSGDDLFVIDSPYFLVDTVELPALNRDVSWGRSVDGGPSLVQLPFSSPGRGNREASVVVVVGGGQHDSLSSRVVVFTVGAVVAVGLLIVTASRAMFVWNGGAVVQAGKDAPGLNPSREEWVTYAGAEAEQERVARLFASLETGVTPGQGEVGAENGGDASPPLSQRQRLQGGGGGDDNSESPASSVPRGVVAERSQVLGEAGRLRLTVRSGRAGEGGEGDGRSPTWSGVGGSGGRRKGRGRSRTEQLSSRGRTRGGRGRSRSREGDGGGDGGGWVSPLSHGSDAHSSARVLERRRHSAASGWKELNNMGMSPLMAPRQHISPLPLYSSTAASSAARPQPLPSPEQLSGGWGGAGSRAYARAGGMALSGSEARRLSLEANKRNADTDGPDGGGALRIVVDEELGTQAPVAVVGQHTPGGEEGGSVAAAGGHGGQVVEGSDGGATEEEEDAGGGSSSSLRRSPHSGTPSGGGGGGGIIGSFRRMMG